MKEGVTLRRDRGAAIGGTGTGTLLAGSRERVLGRHRQSSVVFAGTPFESEDGSAAEVKGDEVGREAGKEMSDWEMSMSCFGIALAKPTGGVPMERS